MSKNNGNKVDWRDKTFISQIIEESVSYSDVLKKLGLVPSSNMRTLKKYIQIYDIDTSHFDPLLNRPQTQNGSTKRPLEDFLVQNSTRVDRYGLKKRLINEGYLQYKCAKCNNSGVWMGEQLTLQLEHKNGINNDNRLENLELLCPNCHSQTKTYAGRNKIFK